MLRTCGRCLNIPQTRLYLGIHKRLTWFRNSLSERYDCKVATSCCASSLRLQRQPIMSLPIQVQAGHITLEPSHRLLSRSPCQPSCSGRQTAALSKCRAAPASIETQTTPITGKSFIRPHLLNMEPYTPILPFEILSKQMGMDPHDIVKLDANENPYGPPPEVREALGKMQFPNIYPDPETRRLRTALSELNDIPVEHLLVGCGADELIDLLMRCVLDPGDSILDTPPTFTMYKFDAAVNNAKVITVSRKEDFSIDVPGITAAVEQYKPKIVFLTSPNNPDGSLIQEHQLKSILQLPVLVVLDEAYIEFADEPSRLKWVQQCDNLVVLRTFSKSAALAGIRVGYGSFPLSMIDYLWRAKQPYNVSAASEVAACAALQNMAYLKDVREKLVNERGRMMQQLQSIVFLQVFPSSANFILCKVTQSHDAKDVKLALAKDGVMVRHYAQHHLSGYIRISVGKPEQTDKLLAALRKL